MSSGELVACGSAPSDFRTLREAPGFVDKTEAVGKFCEGIDYVLLSRPEGFGKTALITTVESLFRYGLRDFRGLAVERTWKEDRTYDVVRLDFAELKGFESAAVFRDRLETLLRERFAAVGFSETEGFTDLILNIACWLEKRPHRSLVVLVDGYDVPLLEALRDPTLMRQVGGLIMRFLKIFEANSGALRFYCVTGSTRLGDADLFRPFDFPINVSRCSDYAGIAGFTEAEMESSFPEALERAGKALGIGREELLRSMRSWYGGHSFDRDGLTEVFCPRSVLTFIARPEDGFRPYRLSDRDREAVAQGLRVTQRQDHALPVRRNLCWSNDLECVTPYDDIAPSVYLSWMGILMAEPLFDCGGPLAMSAPNREEAEYLQALDF